MHFAKSWEWGHSGRKRGDMMRPGKEERAAEVPVWAHLGLPCSSF